MIQVIFVTQWELDPSKTSFGEGSSVVWLAIISSSLSIGAALLDIYSAKKLFDVLEPNGKALGRTSCSMHLLSQEIKAKAKKLQITTYALRDAIAETVTTHPRAVEMHFPITTADGFKIGFSVNSDKLGPNDIYEKLRKNIYTEDLHKKINTVWGLKQEAGRLRIPIKQLQVDGVDTEQYHDFEERLEAQKTKLQNHNSYLHEEGGNVEMVHIGNAWGMKQVSNLTELTEVDEGNVKESNGVFAGHSSPVKSTDDKRLPLMQNTGPISDFDAKMAAINAQIAMNQYLMMKQMERMEVHSGNTRDNSEFQTMMMEHMQQMNGMITMDTPYDPAMFQRFQEQWHAYHQPDPTELENKHKSTAL